MSIKETQVLDRDALNRGFVSKNATGTQIMAGSLRLLGGITVSGTLLTGLIDAGASQIKTTGRIDAGTFYGSGAGLTSLNGSNISSGTVADARLTTNVMLLNNAQTITGGKTFTSENYFHRGTYTDPDPGVGRAIKFTAGIAGDTLKLTGGLTALGVSSIASGTKIIGDNTGIANASWLGFYESNGSVRTGFVGDGSTGNDTIFLYADRGDASIVSNGGSSINVGKSGVIDLSGTVTNVIGGLDVQGELKSGINNEFPDPLITSKSVSLWDVNKNGPAGTYVFDNAQAPVGTGALGSLKITATLPDAYTYYVYDFDVNPNEWITFSTYLFSTTTSKPSQLYIRWLDASKNAISHVSTDIPNTPTSWTRYKLTAQAPSNARYFNVRVDNDGGSTTYSVSAVTDADATANTGSTPVVSAGVWKKTDTITFTINTGPALGTISSSAGVTYTATQDATTATLYHVSGNDGASFDLSISGAAAGDNWKFTVTQTVVTSIIYYSAFQVERGRAMTGFKPYQGGKDVSIYTKDNMGTIQSGNAAITLDGSGTNKTLWVGGTGASVRIEGNLVGNTASFSGLVQLNGGVKGNGTNTALRVQTDYGYLDVGAMNTSWAHFQTDRPRYYFDKGITVDTGLIGSYAQDLQLQTSGTTRMTVSNTNGNVGIAVSAPAQALDVNGNINLSGSLMVAGSTLVRHEPETYGRSALVGAAGSSIALVAGESTSNHIIRYLNDSEIAYVAGNQVHIETNGEVDGAYKSFIFDEAGYLGIGVDPAITLAIGDADTGFHWNSDGNFDIKANNVTVANVTSGHLNIRSSTIASSNVNTAYYYDASIELREVNQAGAQTGAWSEAPRLGFHWSGRVASQILMNTAGDICIVNNPGNGYEDFRALNVNAHGSLWTAGNFDADGKNHILGASSNWDSADYNAFTTLKFQGHNRFWVGAGNSTWYTRTATTAHHDLLITTMNSDATYTRGITFAAQNDDATGAAGYRLGRWYSGTGTTSTRLEVDGSLKVADKVEVGSTAANARSNKTFSMEYNSTEDSLDFVYNG